MELKLEKICNLGVIQLNFLAKTHGIIGVGFHYKNSKNFYSFEIAGEVVKYCTMRKVVDGVYRKIERKEETCGYENNVWYQLVIQLYTDKIIVYMAKDGEGLVEVMRGDFDQDFKNGKFSLLTYKTQAAFTNIQMLPSDDVNLKMKKPRSFGGDGEEGGMEELDNDDGSEDSKAEDSNEDSNGKPKPKHQENEKSEPDTCLDKKSPQDREKYCKDKFPDNIAAHDDCMTNFCPRCCDKFVD